MDLASLKVGLVVVLCLFGMIVTCGLLYLSYLLNVVYNAIRSIENRPKQPHEKKIVVPGRGIFSQPKPKKVPKYHSEEDVWVKEKDEII